jgi:HK97 family phage portal protein
MLERLIAWLGLEQRALTYADPALQRLYGPSAGEPVTVDRAVSLSAVWACVSLISGSIASMPLILFRKTDEGREKAVDHVLFDVLRLRPNPTQSVVSFLEAMVTALLLRGNGYALITRDDDGRVRALWYVNPDRVHLEITKSGTLRYEVSTPSGRTKIPPGQMLHIPGPLSDDGYTGRSVISTFRETLGLGLSLESYSSEYFLNSATPAGVLSAPMTLSAGAIQKLRDGVDAAHKGKGKRHGTLILEQGIKYEPLALSPEDSQLIQARAFTVQEVARLFGVPVSMINGDQKLSLTYANAETRALDFVKFCLGPWLARIESAVAFHCISPLERRVLYPEFLADALLASDTKSRYEAYTLGVQGGWLQLDEIRAKENLPPLPERIPSIS